MSHLHLGKYLSIASVPSNVDKSNRNTKHTVEFLYHWNIELMASVNSALLVFEKDDRGLQDDLEVLIKYLSCLIKHRDVQCV